MELVYIWVEKYNNLENIEINFDTQYAIHYDKEQNIIDVKKKDTKISEGFFGKNISNITAIVGKNGVGKSTLLRCIMDILRYRSENSGKGFKHILCLKTEENKLRFIASDNEKVEIKHELDNDSIELEVRKYIEKKYVENITQSMISKIIYISNAIDWNDFLMSKGEEVDNIKDMSTGALLRRKETGNNSYQQSRENSILDYHYDDIFRQVNFISKYSRYREQIQFKLPNKIGISVKIITGETRIQEEKNEILKEINFERDIIESFIARFFSDSWQDNKEDIIRRILRGVLVNYIYGTLASFGKDDKEFENVYKIIVKLENEESLKQDYIKIINKFLAELDERKLEDTKRLEKLKEFIGWIIENKSKIKCNQYNLSAFYMELEEIDILKEFFNKYMATCIYKYYLTFSWVLSSGECMLLNMYARIYDARNSYWGEWQDESNDLLLIIDEADMGFHPEWQRKYIKSLLNFISIVCADAQVQIVLSTHSPLILSDIPSSNIVRLSYSNDGTIVEQMRKETFGANIHNLFRDTFFMDSTIGEFAKSKIDEVIELINSGEESEKMSRDRAKEIIQLIGEPIIRHKLEHMYYERFPEEKEMDISSYKEYIQVLEERLNNKNIDSIQLKQLETQMESVLKQIKTINNRGIEG